MARTSTLDVILAMAAEGRANHATLVGKVDEVLAAAASHELKDVHRFAEIDKRLEPMEATRKTLRWVIGSGFVAGLGIISDLIVNHLFHK